MPQTTGTIEQIPLRKVWPKEDGDFTPWLESHIGELDKFLGIGLTDAQREVGAGDFRIDLVADTNFGDVVIENQFGRSDHRHLGQLVTYLSYRDVQRAIWIVEQERPEHVKAVKALNDRGVGQIWMVRVEAIKIDDSRPAALFKVVAEPPDIEMPGGDDITGPSPVQIQKRSFMEALFAQAQRDGIDSPFKNLSPSIHGVLNTPARGQGLLYGVAVNRKESRVVLRTRKGKWLGALGALREHREEIDRAFVEAGLRKLEWPEHANAGRWDIRYTVDTNYREPDENKLRELNEASAAMKHVFDRHVQGLDPQIEDDA